MEIKKNLKYILTRFLKSLYKNKLKHSRFQCSLEMLRKIES